MKLRKVMAAVLAAAIPLFCGVPALAVTAEEEKTPDLVFYRAKATDTFEGEINIRNGKGEVTDVRVKDGEEPAFYLSDFDDTLAYFDSLYKSAEQTLTVTRDGKDYDVTANLAVYDSVELFSATGSVTLTVKDNRTLQPVANTEYSLYRAGKLIKKELISDSKGKITVDGLLPGEYELRQTAASTGYQATEKPVPFTIGGLELSGGDQQIRTTAGKKVTADENEVLIAGTYTPDIVLEAAKEEQISSLSVVFQNSGAALESAGKAVTKTFSSAAEAEKAINTAKKDGEITGPVLISYTLSGNSERSTCNFIQYVEAETSKTTATPAPTPDNSYNPGWNVNNGNQGATATSTPTPTPTLSTAPTAAPSTEGSVTVYASCNDKPLRNIMFELIGRTTAGTGVDKTYRTDDQGFITIDKVPEGTYTLIVLETEETEIYDIPYDQRVSVAPGASSYVSVDFSLLTNDIAGIVTDKDGTPLPNVTVGLYSVEYRIEQENLSGNVKSKNEVDDISGRTYYNAANATALAITDEHGEFNFSWVEIGEYELMPLVSGGYFPPDKPASCIVTKDDADLAEIIIDCTCVSVSYLGKNGGQLTGRTVTIDDQEGTTWVTSEDPMVLKGLIPGTYTLTVQSEEGKESIDSFSFTVEETTELQEVIIKTSATEGETNVPEKEPESTPADQPERSLLIIPIVIAGIVLAAGLGFLVWYRKKHKPEKGGLQ